MASLNWSCWFLDHPVSVLCFSGSVHIWVISERLLDHVAFDFDELGVGVKFARIGSSNLWWPQTADWSNGQFMMSCPLWVPALVSIVWTMWLWCGATRSSRRSVVFVGGAILLWWLSIAARVQYFGSEWSVAVGGGGVRLIERHDKMPAPGTFDAGLHHEDVMWGVSWGGNGCMLGVPLWPLVAVLVIGTVVLYCRRSGVDRCCADCGYDCTGVPEGAPCPECGKARTDG